ncbi:MAG TPA: ABC transporter substrate-binding protein, partial [Clostridia bacterium]|nr:ABC transporter substrate-binding protein [Clostridia bacterium]
MYRIKTIIVIVLIMAFAVTVYSFRKQENIFVHHNQSTSQPEYEIVWYHANAPQKETKLVMDKVNKYLKQKINVKLRLKLIDNGDYDNVLKAAISSGEKFDICFTSVWMNSYVHNALKGSFKELGPLLKKYGKGIVKAMPKVLLEGARVNGKIYALPSIKEPGHQWCILINKKYADKYDF